MKHTRMTSVVIGILMGLAPLPVLSQTNYPYSNKQAVENTVSSAQKAAEPTASVNASDKSFARNAAQIGMAEVELANLAQTKSSDEAVKDFAKKMVTEHAKANERLRAIVSRHYIGWPADLNAATKWEKNKLSKLSGAAFDKEYMNAMIQGHQSAIADFQRAASNAKEPSIKDFASETLPSLKEHLKLAEQTLAKPAPTRSSL